MKGVIPFSESSKLQLTKTFQGLRVAAGFREREPLVPAPHPSRCGSGVGELPKSARAGKARIVSDNLEIIS